MLGAPEMNVLWKLVSGKTNLFNMHIKSLGKSTHGKTLKFSSIIMAVISYMKTRLNSICDRKNVISGDELVCLIGTLISKFATVKKPLDLQSFSSSSSSKSSSKSSAASLVQLVPRQCPHVAEHSRSCFYMCIACYYNQTSSCTSQHARKLLVLAEVGS